MGRRSEPSTVASREIKPDQADQGVAGHRPTGEQLGGSGGPRLPLRHQLAHRHAAGSVEDHPQGAVVAVVEDQHHPSGEVGVGQAGGGHQQVAGQTLRRGGAAVGLERAERFDRHLSMMAHRLPRVAPGAPVGEAGPMALVSVDSVRPHVRLVTLDNPSRLNSMSFALVTDLYAALEEVAADNDCRVVVLTGAGRAFCSGLELEHAGLPPGTEDLGRHRMGMRAMEYMGGIVPAMRSIPQPIIAAIKGPAYGGGMCLSLGADIRLAGTVGRVLRRRHQQRAERDRARGELAAAPGRRDLQLGRDPADRQEGRCRGGPAHRSGVPGGGRRRGRRPGRRPWPRGCAPSARSAWP